ncbi:solute carrier family 12 member 9 [Coccinella septempunctata]|uniref:solute carrier family 12 member 9 n=1 Tax=Coccinella septempunctata TaxID=41139 RepID=UPI001D0768A9|nr:solute carrier family 12 member 9 [Coccinella septempunctata]
MLAPETGSANYASSEAGTNSKSFMRKISGILSASSSERYSTDGGPTYVEFSSFNEPSDTRTLGTFAGVFSPVTLSMFSALIFLRMGYIVGNAGLIVTLLQFAIAYLILVSTVASVCAISTNGAVEGGGAYFMISRTLGPEFGGSIGTLFFFANIVSSALCISGCIEGLVENFGPSGYLLKGIIPDGVWWKFLYCSGLNTLNLLVCLIGAGMFAKTTVFILAIVCGCLGITVFSFFYQGFMMVDIPESNELVSNITRQANYTGLNIQTLSDNLYPQYGKDYTSHGDIVTFATVFGVLFSGVTGIMAGANMSGELKSPSKSIPFGTLSGVAFTFIVYLLISFLTAGTCSTFLMQNNYLFMAGVSIIPSSVAIGLLTATWSASLSNVIGGSRVLEALCKDDVYGALLSFIPKGTWRGNPIAAVLVSWLLVQQVLLIGSLNVIAQLNSVLFLLSYLATNLACLGLEVASAPNFRPSFIYFTWHTAFIGLMGTLIMMFVINPLYAMLSISLCTLLVMLLHLFSPSKEAQWGSISQALIFHQVRKYLLLLDSRKNHVKFWRPQILLLVNNPRTSCPLIDFVNVLKKGGLYVLGHVIRGDPNAAGSDPTLESNSHWLNLIDHLKVKAFVELTVANTIREGSKHLMRISGMGAMKPNTVILGFLGDERAEDFLRSNESSYRNLEFSSDIFPLEDESSLQPVEYIQIMSDVLKLNKNLCICRNFHKLKKDLNKGGVQFIDVWPVNFLNPTEDDAFDITSLFMMQLACIVNMVNMWSKLKMRICVCDEARQSSFSINSNQQSHTERLSSMLKNLRIQAEICHVNSWKNVIEAHYQDSDDYFRGINNLIYQKSEDTAVTFIYLPNPPSSDDAAESFFRKLEMISNNLPPTIFVHGVSMVTSTTL